MKRINRIGEIRISNEGYEMKIVGYNEKDGIVIEFQDEYKTKINTWYTNFKNGNIKNPYHPSVYGVGCLGVGRYKSIDKNNKLTIEYVMWCNMLQRCYDAYFINSEKNITYKDVKVCKEWLNFQNFAKWYNENKYGNEKLCLDKDILFKNNKIYSPNTCILVPKRINILFTKSNSNRGKYPMGVYWRKDRNKFATQCSILDDNGKQKIKNLGLYNTPEEAFYVYKQFKESYIKQIAVEYRDLIPQKLYEAMHKYEVEIND